jgi:hypothetical protein
MSRGRPLTMPDKSEHEVDLLGIADCQTSQALHRLRAPRA